MEFNLSESFSKGSEYFNVDYSFGSFFGVLFMTLFLGFSVLFFFSVFYSDKYSSNTWSIFLGNSLWFELTQYEPQNQKKTLLGK